MSNMLSRTMICHARQIPVTDPGGSFRLLIRHFKIKKSSKKRIPSTDKALEHFDTYYRPFYRDKWPSMRIALLSMRKTAAVVNNFADAERFTSELQALGAEDIIFQARERHRSIHHQQHTNQSHSEHEHYLETINKLTGQLDNQSTIGESNDGFVPLRQQNFPAEQFGSVKELDSEVLDPQRKDLDRFVPTKTVYSQSQSLRLEESRRNSIISYNNGTIDVVPSQRMFLPEDLRVFAFPKGDVSRFPDPSVGNKDGYLSFYLMDAASILPVIALNLTAGDQVLDLCAAPGGKTLSILQTGLPESLQCNDISGSRIARLLNILQYHVPDDIRDHVTVTRKHGTLFTEPQFDKVLVDVPCSTDRHSLLEEDNNLFSPSRINDRIQLPSIQKELLKSGIRACVPGGSVVYSTCTLAPSQNDGVVQQAVEEVSQQTGCQLVVEDLSPITDWFQDTFTFFPSCRLGQLVIPSLRANFGPMYFSKINKI